MYLLDLIFALPVVIAAGYLIVWGVDQICGGKD